MPDTKSYFVALYFPHPEAWAMIMPGADLELMRVFTSVFQSHTRGLVL